MSTTFHNTNAAISFATVPTLLTTRIQKIPNVPSRLTAKLRKIFSFPLASLPPSTKG